MKLKLGALILISRFLASAHPVSATSVVCIRTPSSVVIAADSKLAIRGGDIKGRAARECKIIKAGPMYFSMTGFVKDPARPYDAVSIVGEALKSAAPPREPAGAGESCESPG